MKRIVRLALSAIILFAAPAASSALVGISQTGGPASAHTVVVLRSYRNEAGFCSGVVIAPRVILTAAHCVKPASNLAVLVDPNSQELINVTTSVTHPRYVADAPRKHVLSIDLALIRLETNLPPSFRPIPIETNALIRLEQEFVIAGFGLREEKGAPAKELRWGTIVARSPLSNVLLWATDPAKRGFGACTGDSGGPIFDAEVNKLVAITTWSAGIGGRKCGDLTQGILVGAHLEWIGRVMQQWGSR